MLASRLFRIARDILAEYSAFKITELVGEAVNLAASRGGPNHSQYIQTARQIRARANEIISNTIFSSYPDSLLNEINQSEYKTIMPAHVASVLINGVLDDAQLSMSSSELSFYANSINHLFAELRSLNQALSRFSIEPIQIPENEISLDLSIPRGAFEDEADKLVYFQTRLLRTFSYFIELTTGVKGHPRLIYTSTTDPVIAVSATGLSVWAFLQYWKLILEVADKQLTFIKTIRNFKEAGLAADTESFDKHAASVVSGALSSAATEAVSSAQTKVDEGRVAEIMIAIKKDANVVLEAAINGTRISVTIESLDNLDVITEATKINQTDIISSIEEQKILERQVFGAKIALGNLHPALLSMRQEEPAEDRTP